MVQIYSASASAWNGAHRSKLNEALQDAHRGSYDILIVWALDRLSREGIEPTFPTLRQFHERGVAVLSLQEPWLGDSPEIQELVIAVTAWIAQFQSRRRSEQIKAGIARRRAQGKPVGRLLGAKDAKPRKRSGYVQRWEREHASQ